MTALRSTSVALSEASALTADGGAQGRIDSKADGDPPADRDPPARLDLKASVGFEPKESDATGRSQLSTWSGTPGCESWSTFDRFNHARLEFVERKRGVPSLSRGWRTADPSPSRSAAGLPGCGSYFQQMPMGGGMLAGPAAQGSCITGYSEYVIDSAARLHSESGDSGRRLHASAAAFIPADAQDQEKIADINIKEVKVLDEKLHTTVTLRNLPGDYSRAKLLDLLEKKGFGSSITFLYMPVDFRKNTVKGYAFLDFASAEIVPLFWKTFEGFTDWETPSENVCTINWSESHQGLQANIERYMNSSVMHSSVPDECKPMLFKDGHEIPFPKPTRAIKFPRNRDGQPRRSDGKRIRSL